MIDPKYLTRALSVLSKEEQIREIEKAKVLTTVELFQEDFELAQSLGVNLSRIIRFKFHEWLQEKVTEV